MIEKLPANLDNLIAEHPALWDAYQALGKASAEAGPLDGKTRRLVKLALAVGARSEGAAHSHARRCCAEGIAPEEMRQVALLAITSLGFPAAMAGLSWIEDILRAEPAG